MSRTRTRTVLAAALLVTTGLGAPAALAAPACSKPGAAPLHQVHESAASVPVVGPTGSEAAHEVEETYCAL